MHTALVLIFVIAYAVIAFEEPLRVNKSAAGLIGAGVLWSVYALSTGDPALVEENLSHSLVETAQIVFFLIGAMTIVEVIDAHDGFEAITSRIRARSLGALVWTMAVVTFFLSAVLDNLTTTIVMVSLARKLLATREDRLVMAGLTVLVANAGGAWSPIGDVTTTMLWIGGQVTTGPLIEGVFLPSVVNAALPTAVIAWGMRGRPFTPPEASPGGAPSETTAFERNLVFFLGLAVLVLVPVFKGVTHLPPFMGVLLGLGVLWAVADMIHRHKPYEERSSVSIVSALARIDMSAIVFFIGILLAVATLAHAGMLAALAAWLDTAIGRLDVIVMLIGLASAVIDNVPMVAAAMGMYGMEAHPPNSFLWEFMAYCAGTGGSILIIGSAAGVAAMGMEKIDFLWYLRRFAPLALAGYVGGALVYLAETELFNLL